MSGESRAFRILAALGLVVQIIVSGPPIASANTIANPPFERTWARTDRPVVDGRVARTWMWGPAPNSDGMPEPYVEGIDAERIVQYFDKSRMEITDPDAVDDGLWYVSNGLLVVELITGNLQVGDGAYVPVLPANVNVAGDLNDPNGPTYATFNSRLDDEPASPGTSIISRIDRQSNVAEDRSLASRDVSVALVDEVTNHAIAQPFWSFMTSTGQVLVDDVLVEASLFDNPYYATGRPVTEAYWTTVRVAGTPRDVLLQCFERRCLTYTPDNPAGWQVEMGNVGLHYYEWRYNGEHSMAVENVVAGSDTEISLRDLVVSIGTGSVDDSGVVSVVGLENPPVGEDSLIPISDAYDIRLSGAALTGSATLSLAFDEAAVADGVADDEIVIGYYDETRRGWQLVTTEVDRATGRATAQVSHFSIWQVFAIDDPSPPSPPPPAGNQSPRLDLNGDVSGTGSTATFAAGSEPVYLAPEALLGDADDTTLESARIAFANRIDGIDERIGVSTVGTGITSNYDAAQGALTLSGSVPIASYQQVVRSLTYGNSNANPTEGTRSIEVSVNDGGSDSNVAIASVVVLGDDTPPPPPPSNSVPSAEDQTVTLPEDSTLAITLSGEDADGDTLSFSIVSEPQRGTLTGNAPNLTYLPDEHFSGTDTFTFVVTDGRGGTDTGTISITVTAVNDLPVADNDSYSVAEDTALAVSAPGVLINDNDADNDQLEAVLESLPSNGSVQLDASGAFTYTPGDDFTGTDTFTYSVRDGTASSDSATVTIAVGPVNDAPVAYADSYAVDEDATLTVDALGGVLANDSDTEGGTLTANVVSGPALAASLTMNPDGSFVYVPSANAFGTDSFTYAATDGGATSDPTTVTITIAPVNDTPVASDQSASIAEDTITEITVTASDIDGDSLTYSLVDLPASGTATLAGGIVTYTPPSNVYGDDVASFTFTVSDGQFTSAAATVTIDIAPVNDAPSAVEDTFTATEDIALIVSVPAAGLLANDTDIENDGLAVADVVDGPDAGEIVVNADGTFTYTPDANIFGTDTFTYTVSDGSDTSAEAATVTITIDPVNDMPVARDETISADEDTPRTITLTGTDGDGDGLTFFIVGQPGSGTLGSIADQNCVTDALPGVCTATITYTPDRDYDGTDSFSYGVSDGILTSDPATVSLTVTAVNDAPVAADDTYTTREDTPLVVDTVADGVLDNDTDVEGQSLTSTLVDDVEYGTLTLNPDGTFTYTPSANYSGTDRFTYSASDGSDASSSATVTITINPVNDPPVSVAGTETTNEDTPVDITLTGTDIDSATLSFVIASGVASGQGTLGPSSTPQCTAAAGLTICTATVRYTPPTNASGDPFTSFAYTVSDGTLTSTSAMVSISVDAQNDAPSATDDSYSIDEDTELAVAVAAGVLVNDTDVENDPLTATLVDGPDFAEAFTLNPDGSFTYASEDDYAGSDAFTYTAGDGDADSTTATVTITVNPVNDQPVAVEGSDATDEDTPVAITLTSTDADGDTLTFAITAGPGDGAIDASAINDSGTRACMTVGSTSTCTTTMTYTPDENFTGSDTFTFTVSDGTLASVAATVTITVNPVNDTPVLTIDGGPVQFLGEPVVLDAAVTVSDVDSPNFDTGTLSVSITGNAHADDGLVLLASGGVTVSGTDVQLNGVTIGTITGGAIGSGTLVVTFADQATLERVQTLVRALAYDNATDSPVSILERTVSIVLADGDGGGSGTKTAAVIFNRAPVDIALSNTTVVEHASAGTDVGTLSATDPDGDAFTVSLTDDAGGRFEIVDIGSDWVMQVAAGAELDFEANPNSFSVTVTATDAKGAGSSQDFTIALTDVNDAPQLPADVEVSIDEHTNAATEVLTVEGTDPDAGQALSFEIASGNAGDAFQLDVTDRTAIISVKTPSALDYETVPNTTFILDITVKDNGTPERTATMSVTVTLRDVNEPPSVTTTNLSVPENSAVDTLVGTVLATDPEQRASGLTFAIVGGTGQAVFAIDVATGNVTVIDSTALDFENADKDDYTLAIQVTDSNSSPLSGTGTVTVAVTDVNEAPSVTAIADPITLFEYTGNPDDTDAIVTGDSVVTVQATDPEQQSISWSITAGNMAGAFAIDMTTGWITVADATLLDYEDVANRTIALTIQATDSVDTSLFDTATVTIDLQDINEVPVVDDLIVYSGLTGQVRFAVAGADGLLNGAIDPEGTGLTIVRVEPVSSVGIIGAVNPDTDGGFIYDSKLLAKTGFEAFTFTVQDEGGREASGTVRFEFNGKRVWFVNNDAGPGDPDGRASTPFRSLTALMASPNVEADDIVYIGGTATPYDVQTAGENGFVLKNMQVVIGEGAAGSSFEILAGLTRPTVGTQTFPAINGTKPVITNSAGTVLTLGSSNVVRGLTLGQSSGPALSGIAGGTGLVIDDVSLIGTGRAMTLAGYQNASISFDDVTRSGITGAGITLSNLGGSTVSITGTISISTTSGAGVILSNAGTFAVSSTTGTISASGGAGLSITNTTTGGSGLTLASVSSSNTLDGGVGILLKSVNGAVTINGGTITNSAGTAIDVDGGNSNIAIASNVTSSQGNAVVVWNRTGGTVALSGTIANTGAGISVLSNSGGTIAFGGSSKAVTVSDTAAVTLQNNSGATISFTNGGLALSATRGTGFTATGGGTVIITGANNTISTSVGVALNVSDTVIGTGGLQFQSISATGGVNGIVLDSTGTTAGLSVSGIGGSCTLGSSTCTGGIISNTSGDAIALTGTTSPSFGYMRVADSGGHGITGTAVVGMTLNTVVIQGAGDARPESGLYFATANANNLSGTVTITNSIIDSPAFRGADIHNFSGTLNLTVTGSTFSNTVISPPGSVGTGDDLMLIRADAFGGQAAVTRIKVTNSQFINSESDGVAALAQNSSGSTGGGTIHLTVEGSTFNGDNRGGEPFSDNAIVAWAAQGGTVRFTIENNPTIVNWRNETIAVRSDNNGSVQGTISGNTIGTAMTRSGSWTAQGIFLNSDDNADLIVRVQNNTVTSTSRQTIWANAADGTGGTPRMDVSITNNTTTSPIDMSGVYLPSIDVQGTTNAQVCAKVEGNAAQPGRGNAGSVDLLRFNTATFKIEGLPSPTSDASAYVAGRNPASALPVTAVAGTGQFTSGTCRTPVAPESP